jgi:site-specific DNA recombinase
MMIARKEGEMPETATARAIDRRGQIGRERGVIYLRVSSSRQADTDYDEEGFSIPAQRGGCRRKSEAMGVSVGPGDEYIDRGESAKTADRPALQAMLARVESDPSIGYVFVHKIDRLARNRADDIAIVARIRAAGAQIVSVSENIDETPSGVLLHGIMASIAEFYSRNLATEILKGSTQKAKAGGTPTRAPIGYLNVREVVDGREIRTIGLDPERAPLVRLAFELYATGEYSTSDLAVVLEERGLRSRPTPKQPAKPLGANRVQTLLRNDYYVGVVHYRGHSYPGRHEHLVPLPLFQRVQEQLEAKRLSGERERVHHHYLKGTIYCGECGGRLMFSRHKGRQGEAFDYFVCRGRQLRTCSQRYVPVGLVEDAIVRHYARVQLSDAQRERIRALIHERFDGLVAVGEREMARAAQRLEALDTQERKLLERDYAGRVSERVYEREFGRIQRERAAAEKDLDDFNLGYEVATRTLDRALSLTCDVEAAYRDANPTERRFFNQAFFERIEILEDDVSDASLAQPFRTLLDDGFIEALATWTADTAESGPVPTRDLREADHTAVPALVGAGDDRTPDLFLVRGSIRDEMVELRGLEPLTFALPARRSPS